MKCNAFYGNFRKEPVVDGVATEKHSREHMQYGEAFRSLLVANGQWDTLYAILSS